MTMRAPATAKKPMSPPVLGSTGRGGATGEVVTVGATVVEGGAVVGTVVGTAVVGATDVDVVLGGGRTMMCRTVVVVLGTVVVVVGARVVVLWAYVVVVGQSASACGVPQCVHAAADGALPRLAMRANIDATGRAAIAAARRLRSFIVEPAFLWVPGRYVTAVYLSSASTPRSLKDPFAWGEGDPQGFAPLPCLRGCPSVSVPTELYRLALPPLPRYRSGSARLLALRLERGADGPVTVVVQHSQVLAG
jgi:hypothetical protein